MKTRIVLALLAAGALCAGQSALAHHPFAAEYDAEKPVTLTGTLSRMEWVNPHGWIYMDVKQPDGTVQKWTIESSGPGADDPPRAEKDRLRRRDVPRGEGLSG